MALLFGGAEAFMQFWKMAPWLFEIWTSGSEGDVTLRTTEDRHTTDKGSGGDVVCKSSYLELWWPSCSAERNNLCNFGRGHYEEHS